MQALVEALRELLEGTPTSGASSALEQPTSPSEFVEALERITAAGWSFELSSQRSAQLVRNSSTPPGPEDFALMEELQERYPNLPREVAAVVRAVLTGNEPDADIAESKDDLATKREAVERLVITEELRERFYLRHCGKVPRFASIDWEVVVKEAERGHPRAPAFPYALATLDAVDDAHGHHEHEAVTFAIGLHGLRCLVSELSELLVHLEQAHASTKTTSNAVTGDTDA